VTNTLAYFDPKLIMTIKIFIVQAPLGGMGIAQIKNKTEL
jgi:hypothetical protein